jgi:hypothetical protein
MPEFKTPVICALGSCSDPYQKVLLCRQQNISGAEKEDWAFTFMAKGVQAFILRIRKKF